MTDTLPAVSAKPSEIVDYQAEGLFEDVEPSALDARKRLLDCLLDEERVPLDEIKLAAKEKRLMLLPVERALGGEPTYYAKQVAELADIDLDLFIDLRRALGLAQPALEQKAYSEYDVKVMRSVRANLEMGISLEGIREINRVLGAGLSQLAATIERQILTTFLRPDDDEYDIAVRYAEIARMTSPEFGFVLQHLLNLHLREASRADVLGNPAMIDLLSDTREIAVCFADLVGFTSLGEQVRADELGHIAERLNEITLSVVEPPVRLVKTIGDAVMLVSPDSDSLIDTALNLIAAVDSEPEGFPQLSAGLAVGEAIMRGGDVYGPPVNYASRLCDVARPGAVVTTGVLHERYERAYDWTEVGKRRFKGIEQPIEIFRVRERGGREREKSKAKALEQAERELRRAERDAEKAAKEADKSSEKSAKERERIAKNLEKELQKQVTQREKAEAKARDKAAKEAAAKEAAVKEKEAAKKEAAKEKEAAKKKAAKKETDGVVAKPLAAAKQLAAAIEPEAIIDLSAKTAEQLKKLPVKPGDTKVVKKLSERKAAKKSEKAADAKSAQKVDEAKPARKSIPKSAPKSTPKSTQKSDKKPAKKPAARKPAARKPTVGKGDA